MSEKYKRLLISKNYLIENDIPLYTHEKSKTRELLEKMEPGQSIGGLDKAGAAVLRMLAWRSKLEIVQRKEPDGTYRVWKIGKKYATKKRIIEENNIQEHQGGDESREAPEASNSDSPVISREEEKETLEQLLAKRKK